MRLGMDVRLHMGLESVAREAEGIGLWTHYSFHAVPQKPTVWEVAMVDGEGRVAFNATHASAESVLSTMRASADGRVRGLGEILSQQLLEESDAN